MEKALLPANGSPISDYTADEFIYLSRNETLPAELHLLNVQRSGPIIFRPRTWHEARGSCLEAGLVFSCSEKKFDQAGISYTCHALVGNPVQAIQTFCKALPCHGIVMGSRAQGWVRRQFGSTSLRVDQQVDVLVPVIPKNLYLLSPSVRYTELAHCPSFGHERL